VLTEAQAAAIGEIADSLSAEQARLRSEVEARVRGGGDRAEMMAEMRREMRAAGERREAALEAVREVLTTEQWDALPEEIRNPRPHDARSADRAERGDPAAPLSRRGGGGQ
jgi:hypothetical protein